MNKKNLVILLFVGVLMVSFVSAGWFTGYTLKEGKTQSFDVDNVVVTVTNVDRSGVASIDVKNSGTGVVETIKTSGGSVTTSSGVKVDVSNIKKSRFWKKASAIVAVDSKQYKKQTCTDSDVSFLYPNGINPEVKGVVINLQGQEYFDYCQDSNLVYEYACNYKGQVTGQTYPPWDVLNCPNGCWNGVCNSQPFPSNVTNQTNVSSGMHNHLVDYYLEEVRFDIPGGNISNNSYNQDIDIITSLGTTNPSSSAYVRIINIAGDLIKQIHVTVMCDPGYVAIDGGYSLGGKYLWKSSYSVVNSVASLGQYNLITMEPFTPYGIGWDLEGVEGGYASAICAKLENAVYPVSGITEHFP